MAKDWDTTSIDGMERTAKNEADRDCSVKIGAIWLEVSWDGKKFKYKWGKNFVGRDNAIEVFKMKPVMDGYKKALKGECEMDKQAELVAAAKAGIIEYLRSTRGANLFGSKVQILDTKKGFVVVTGEDDRVYFDLSVM